jgi:hypothetical protein
MGSHLTDEIIDLIFSGKYSQAASMLSGSNISIDNIKPELLLKAFDSGSISPYAFLCSLLDHREAHVVHEAASEIMSTALSHIPGAYSVALYHARKLVELDPDNVENREYLLLFHAIPDKLINDAEAVELAKDILKRKPDSKAAKGILGSQSDSGD